MYKIVVSYETGDSFGSWDTSDSLGPWCDLDVAKENLVRIQEHYKFYEEFDKKGLSSWARNPPTEKQKQKFFQETGLTEIPRWFYGHYWPAGIVLLDDNKEEIRESVNWCGYFERLYGAEIRAQQEDGWSFTV